MSEKEVVAVIESKGEEEGDGTGESHAGCDDSSEFGQMGAALTKV